MYAPPLEAGAAHRPRHGASRLWQGRSERFFMAPAEGDIRIAGTTLLVIIQAGRRVTRFLNALAWGFGWLARCCIGRTLRGIGRLYDDAVCKGHRCAWRRGENAQR